MKDSKPTTSVNTSPTIDPQDPFDIDMSGCMCGGCQCGKSKESSQPAGCDGCECGNPMCAAEKMLDSKGSPTSIKDAQCACHDGSGC